MGRRGDGDSPGVAGIPGEAIPGARPRGGLGARDVQRPRHHADARAGAIIVITTNNNDNNNDNNNKHIYRSLGVVSDKIASAKRNPVQTGNTTTTPPPTTTTTTTTNNNNDNNKGR